jgi:hypothetical protein
LDHYFLTLQQGQLIFCYTVGTILSYSYKKN